MRAVGVWRFGGPEELKPVELPEPEAGPGEIRILVAGATVNPTDTLFRSGKLTANLSPGAIAPFVPGREISGVVDRAGPGARFKEGDLVATLPSPLPLGRGGYSELIVIHGDSAIASPPGWSPIEAATLAMNGLTVRAAIDQLALRPGQSLAVTGAAGAVGGYAIQMAVTEGLTVVALASPGDEQLVLGLGAQVFAARSADPAGAVRAAFGGPVDGLLDAALIGEPSLAAIREGGVYAAVRGYSGRTERGIRIENVGVGEHARDRAKLEKVYDLAAHRVLTPRVAGTLPAEEAAKAHRTLEAGGLRGRLVLTF